jgi:DNA-binding protein HU-beta
MTKLTKTDVIAQLAAATQSSKTQAEQFLNAFIDLITETVKKGEQVALTGFGSFTRTKRNKRQGINPKTGKAITIPESYSVNFKVGKKLKESVN